LFRLCCSIAERARITDLTYFEGIILGLVQGLAEFLPISSSGHLAVLQNFFGIEGESVLLFAVLLHFGTLLSLIAVYWKDLWELIKELFATIKDLCTGRGLRLNSSDTRRLGVMIVIATIPTAIIGLLFDDFFEALYSSNLFIGCALIVTGCLLFFSERVNLTGKGIRRMNFRNAVFVGLCQSVAICPGISRSGATMSGGLFCGLKRDLAVKFAFLISVPPVLGSFLLELPDALEMGLSGQPMGPVLVGMVVAAVSGFFAIKGMIRVVTGKKLIWFSLYTWIVGTALILHSLLA